MCGRYGFYKDRGDDRAAAVVSMLDRLYPDVSYKTGEIFPGDTAPGVIDDGGRILPVPAVFGFPGTRDGKLLINARSETAARKPAFAESLRQRRMSQPADGARPKDTIGFGKARADLDWVLPSKRFGR